MLSRIRSTIGTHISKNHNTYIFLLLTLAVGVIAGAFTVNGLSAIQKDELSNYFQGFLQLLDNQKVDSSELFLMVLSENIKIIVILWVLGVTIIGIPFIYLLVGIKGFIIGFSAGFIIYVTGLKGVLFTAFALLPKEIIIIPCIIALGVNGINFSLKIIKSKSIKNALNNNIKSSFFSYSFVTLFFSSFILVGILIESYVTPVFIRMIAPVITG